MKYTIYLVRVLHVHLCYAKPGTQVFHQINNHAINLSKISHTGMCYVFLTTVTSYNYPILQHPLNILTKLINSHYTLLVTTWMHW